MKGSNKPSVITWVLFALALLVLGQVQIDSTTFIQGATEPDRMTGYMANSIQRVGRGSAATWEIRWLWLLTVLLLLFGVNWLIELLFRRACDFADPVLGFCVVVGCSLILLFIGSILTSKAMWGYYLFRPAPLAIANELVRVDQIDVFRRLDKTLTPSEPLDLPMLTKGDPGDYYCLEGRLAHQLRRRNLLPEELVRDAALLDQLPALISRSGFEATPEIGYDPYRSLRGVVIKGQNSKGRGMVLLGLCPGQVSNDHYPYYELCFWQTPGGQLEYADGLRFFYDTAGVEGMEWWVVFCSLAFPAALAAMLLCGLCKMGMRLANGRRLTPATQ
jgi:hypothetical protein